MSGRRASIQDSSKTRKVFVCIVCDYRFIPGETLFDSQIESDKAPDALPGDWKCPECGAGISCFIETVIGKEGEC